jgi:hypothetical protein
MQFFPWKVDGFSKILYDFDYLEPAQNFGSGSSKMLQLRRLRFRNTTWKNTNKGQGECSYHTPIRALLTSMKSTLCVGRY